MAAGPAVETTERELVITRIVEFNLGGAAIDLGPDVEGRSA